MAVFILPTTGSTKYRGKYPTRARSVGGSLRHGWHVELNNGTRLFASSVVPSKFMEGGLNTDYAEFLAKAVKMTPAHYECLQEAARVLRTRVCFAGRGPRAHVEDKAAHILNAARNVALYHQAATELAADAMARGDDQALEKAYGHQANAVEHFAVVADPKGLYDAEATFEGSRQVAALREALAPVSFANGAIQLVQTRGPDGQSILTKAPSSYAPGTPEAEQAAAKDKAVAAVLFAGASAMVERQVFQDGRDFYVGTELETLQTVTYPRRVADFDTVAAADARDWFAKVWAPMNNVRPVFVGESF